MARNTIAALKMSKNQVAIRSIIVSWLEICQSFIHDSGPLWSSSYSFHHFHFTFLIDHQSNDIVWREVGWNELAGELAPDSIGSAMLARGSGCHD